MRGLGLFDIPFITPAVITPASYGNLVRWWKADSFSLADNTAIGGGAHRWTNLAGSGDLGDYLAQALPYFRTNVFNGLPAIQFLGGQALAFSSALTLSGDFTAIFVMTETVTDGSCMSSSAGNIQFRCKLSGAEKVFFYDGSASATSNTLGLAETNLTSISWRRSGTNMTFRQNKSGMGTSNLNATNSFAVDTIGKLQLYGYYMTGYIGEILIYTENRSDADMDALYDSYLKPRWGLA